MAKLGVLPHRLAICNVPVCSACQYAKATRRPWQSKTAQNWNNELKPTQPGQVVSVDQLVSPTPGRARHPMSGFLTKERCRYATVYVDQASGLGYVHLQKTASSDKTLEKQNRIRAIRYQTIAYSRQMHGLRRAKLRSKTSLSLPLAHTAERRICELQEMARTCSSIRTNDGKQSMHIPGRMPYTARMTESTLS